jgi:hypothetical protein
MKKKLEAELISIAHRILKLKNKSDVDQLYNESRNLYEKLAILRFAEQSFGGAKPTIGVRKIEDELESYTTAESIPGEENTAINAPAEPVAEAVNAVASEENQDENHAQPEAEIFGGPAESVHESEKVDADQDNTVGTDSDEKSLSEAEVPQGEEVQVAEEAETAISAREENEPETEETVQDEETKPEETVKNEFFVPSFDLTFEKKDDKADEQTTEPKQITFDDLLGPNYSDPIFEKVEAEAPKVEFDGAADGERDDFSRAVTESVPVTLDLPTGDYKPYTTKETPSRQITFGLNDRIGFEKNLFGGSSEDMNRVISQLSTFDTFAEAHDFIEDMVKPDYNNWEGKEDYAKRFMAIIEQKFC